MPVGAQTSRTPTHAQAHPFTQKLVSTAGGQATCASGWSGPLVLLREVTAALMAVERRQGVTMNCKNFMFVVLTGMSSLLSGYEFRISCMNTRKKR